MECVIHCPNRRAGFRTSGLVPSKGAPVIERRVFIGGAVTGLFLSRFFRFRDPAFQNRLLRPPGVRDEAEFLKRCVRCGECMKVCLRSALYPAFLQAGLEGLYTPLMVPRLGYCEYNCTLCGQVCPTGAIPELPVTKKRPEVIGKAVFIKDHCIPFAKRMDCIVCEEHCPIPRKAIRSETVTMTGFSGETLIVRMPYVVEDLCNGCGICENICPLEGKAGIEIYAVKDRKPIDDYADERVSVGPPP
jgi:ferredoxin